MPPPAETCHCPTAWVAAASPKAARTAARRSRGVPIRSTGRPPSGHPARTSRSTRGTASSATPSACDRRSSVRPTVARRSAASTLLNSRQRPSLDQLMAALGLVESTSWLRGAGAVAAPSGKDQAAVIGPVEKVIRVAVGDQTGYVSRLASNVKRLSRGGHRTARCRGCPAPCVTPPPGRPSSDTLGTSGNRRRARRHAHGRARPVDPRELPRLHSDCRRGRRLTARRLTRTKPAAAGVLRPSPPRSSRGPRASPRQALGHAAVQPAAPPSVPFARRPPGPDGRIRAAGVSGRQPCRGAAVERAEIDARAASGVPRRVEQECGHRAGTAALRCAIWRAGIERGRPQSARPPVAATRIRRPWRSGWAQTESRRPRSNCHDAGSSPTRQARASAGRRRRGRAASSCWPCRRSRSTGCRVTRTGDVAPSVPASGCAVVPGQRAAATAATAPSPTATKTICAAVGRERERHAAPRSRASRFPGASQAARVAAFRADAAAWEWPSRRSAAAATASAAIHGSRPRDDDGAGRRRRCRRVERALEQFVDARAHRRCR